MNFIAGPIDFTPLELLIILFPYLAGLLIFGLPIFFIVKNLFFPKPGRGGMEMMSKGHKIASTTAKALLIGGVLILSHFAFVGGPNRAGAFVIASNRYFEMHAGLILILAGVGIAGISRLSRAYTRR